MKQERLLKAVKSGSPLVYKGSFLVTYERLPTQILSSGHCQYSIPFGGGRNEHVLVYNNYHKIQTKK